MSSPNELNPRYAVVAPNTFGSYNSYILTDWSFCPVQHFMTGEPSIEEATTNLKYVHPNVEIKVVVDADEMKALQIKD